MKTYVDLEIFRRRYRQANRQGKRVLLNELCDFYGYNRRDSDTQYAVFIEQLQAVAEADKTSEGRILKCWIDNPNAETPEQEKFQINNVEFSEQEVLVKYFRNQRVMTL